MCAVSAVGDDWTNKFKQTGVTDWFPYQPSLAAQPSYVSRAEFNNLQAMVLTMKAELEAARAQDIANNEPDCEMEEKVVLLKKFAEVFGVDLKEVFPND